MMTLLILATTPWSHVEMTAVVISAIAEKTQQKTKHFFFNTFKTDQNSIRAISLG